MPCRTLQGHNALNVSGQRPVLRSPSAGHPSAHPSSHNRGAIHGFDATQQRKAGTSIVARRIHPSQRVRTRHVSQPVLVRPDSDQHLLAALPWPFSACNQRAAAVAPGPCPAFSHQCSTPAPASCHQHPLRRCIRPVRVHPSRRPLQVSSTPLSTSRQGAGRSTMNLCSSANTTTTFTIATATTADTTTRTQPSSSNSSSGIPFSMPPSPHLSARSTAAAFPSRLRSAQSLHTTNMSPWVSAPHFYTQHVRSRCSVVTAAATAAALTSQSPKEDRQHNLPHQHDAVSASQDSQQQESVSGTPCVEGRSGVLSVDAISGGFFWVSIHQSAPGEHAQVYFSPVPLDRELFHQLDPTLKPLAELPPGLSFRRCPGPCGDGWHNYLVHLAEGDVGAEVDTLFPNRLIHEGRVAYNVPGVEGLARWLADPVLDSVCQHVSNLVALWLQKRGRVKFEKVYQRIVEHYGREAVQLMGLSRPAMMKVIENRGYVMAQP